MRSAMRLFPAVSLFVLGCAGGPATPQSQEVQVAGDYELRSTFDLSKAGILPDVVNDTLGDLSHFKDKPAETILDLLKAAHVPIADTILSIIPGFALGPVESFVDTLIKNLVFANVPALDHVADVISGTAAGLQKFDVITTLSLPQPGEDGSGVGEHALTGVVFTVNGMQKELRLPELISLATKDNQVPMNVLDVGKGDSPVENARLMVGDHAFDLAIGQYAVVGLDAYLQQKLGAADLQELLGKVINCDALAQQVAGKCVAGFCVGHEAQIQSFCESGLSLVASQVEAKLKAIVLKLRFTGGEARLYDAPGGSTTLDGKIDRVEAGGWDLHIGLGPLSKDVSAPFSGERVF